jgi:multiple sugar transport system ATP-binding protein
MTLGDRVAVLRRGVLQQLATPRELYTQPVNLFVAGFIGSPPMNFLPAQVKGDQLELPFGSLTIPADKAAKAADRGLLIAGIRPEHFNDAAVLDAQTKAKGSTFTAHVDVVEWLGHEAYAYVPFEAPPEVAQQLAELERDLDGESIRTQLVIGLDANSAITKGEDAEIWVDSSEVHLFDPETGENLTLG